MSGRGITGRAGIFVISSGNAIGPNSSFITPGFTEQVCVAGIDQNQLAADAPVRWWGQMAQNEISSCNLVRASDLYFRLNVVCEPTVGGHARPEETFLGLPRGFTWRPMPIQLANELHNRAAHRRQMAGTVTTTQVGDARRRWRSASRRWRIGRTSREAKEPRL